MAVLPPMQHKPTSLSTTAFFLAVSAVLSVAVLSTRNLYDDEISSLHIVISPTAAILRTAAKGDVHPAGMYLLAHFAYGLIPSFRWMDLFPCLLVYAGLAVFLFHITPLITGMRSRLCLLLLAALHPQLLMWNNTYRWYSWWTGLALITLTLALQPRHPRPVFGVTRGLTMAFLLACLFYLNYITLLFGVALAAAMALRYCDQTWKRRLAPALLTLAVFLALIAPQLHTMITVHLPDSAAQRSSLAVSCLRLLQSVLTSEAYLPWHPLAIVACVLFVVLTIAGMAALLRLYRSAAMDALDNPLASLLLFGLIFFVLVALAGLGGKPRNGLLLIPVLAPVAALILGTLRPRTQSAVLLLLALWSAVGIGHILGRRGLVKASMNSRPEQVVAFVRRTIDSDCAVVLTYDPELAFSLAEASLPRVLIFAPLPNAIIGSRDTLPAGCEHTRVYAVESALDANDPWTQRLNRELQASTHLIKGPARADSFSFDPDARTKRRLARIPGLRGDLASAASLPDYRYVVTSGLIERTDHDALRRATPDFRGDGE